MPINRRGGFCVSFGLDTATNNFLLFSRDNFMSKDF